jgi:hypothetical protein
MTNTTERKAYAIQIPNPAKGRERSRRQHREALVLYRYAPSVRGKVCPVCCLLCPLVSYQVGTARPEPPIPTENQHLSSRCGIVEYFPNKWFIVMYIERSRH